MGWQISFTQWETLCKYFKIWTLLFPHIPDKEYTTCTNNSEITTQPHVTDKNKGSKKELPSVSNSCSQECFQAGSAPKGRALTSGVWGKGHRKESGEKGSRRRTGAAKTTDHGSDSDPAGLCSVDDLPTIAKLYIYSGVKDKQCVF